MPFQSCRWLSSDVSQNSTRDLCTGNWIPLRVNNIYILAVCYPFTTEFPPQGIYSLCSDIWCHFDSTVWISLEVWLHPINTRDWQRSHHVCQRTANWLHKWRRMKTLKSAARAHAYICWKESSKKRLQGFHFNKVQKVEEDRNYYVVFLRGKNTKLPTVAEVYTSR